MYTALSEVSTRANFGEQKALNSRLGRADNTKFLEQFRYVIVASQLLNENLYHGQGGIIDSSNNTATPTSAPQLGAFTLTGAVTTASLAFCLVWTIHWARGGHSGKTIFGRVAIVLTLVAVFATLAYAYVRRQWLQYLRQQTVAEASTLVGRSQGLDSAISAAVTLIQEVELVSRGYRMWVLR